MAKRKRSRNGLRNGDGFRYRSFAEAYHDALYGAAMEEILRVLREPKMREILNRQNRELLQEMLKYL